MVTKQHQSIQNVVKQHKTRHAKSVARPGAFVKLEEAQRDLKLHIATLRKLCRAGRLPAVRIGGRWFLRRSEWNALKRERVAA